MISTTDMLATLQSSASAETDFSFFFFFCLIQHANISKIIQFKTTEKATSVLLYIHKFFRGKRGMLSHAS